MWIPQTSVSAAAQWQLPEYMPALITDKADVQLPFLLQPEIY